MVKPKYVFRIVLAGDTDVGKTAIARNWTKQQFKEAHQPTVGVEFFHGVVQLPNRDSSIKIHLWDTAGQERYGVYNLTPNYFRHGVAVIFVYDMTKRRTFEGIPRWMEFANKYASSQGHTSILVANKTDRIAERVISYDEGLRFAKDHGMKYFEASAKTGHNIDGVLQGLTEDVNLQFENGHYKLKAGWDGIHIYERKDPFTGGRRRRTETTCC